MFLLCHSRASRSLIIIRSGYINVKSKSQLLVFYIYIYAHSHPRLFLLVRYDTYRPPKHHLRATKWYPHIEFAYPTALSQWWMWCAWPPHSELSGVWAFPLLEYTSSRTTSHTRWNIYAVYILDWDRSQLKGLCIGVELYLLRISKCRLNSLKIRIYISYACGDF